MKTVRLGAIELCYEVFGSKQDPTIVLIPGLGSQMIRWENEFCHLLVKQGYQVVRFDNRDSGSSVFDVPPSFPEGGNPQALFARLKPTDIPYSLLDMAKDVVGLLDYLQVEKVHVVGRSMGGIIAQLLAADFPARVLTTTLLMTTSLRPDLPATRPDILTLLTSPRTPPSVDKDTYMDECYRFTVAISGSKFIPDRETEYAMQEAELMRSKVTNGTLRQLMAMGSWVYNPELFHQIKVPILVIHGTEDPIFPMECAQDLQQAITDANLLLLEGMGHNLPISLFKTVADAIVANCGKAIADYSVS